MQPIKVLVVAMCIELTILNTMHMYMIQSFILCSLLYVYDYTIAHTTCHSDTEVSL